MRDKANAGFAPKDGGGGKHSVRHALAPPAGEHRNANTALISIVRGTRVAQENFQRLPQTVHSQKVVMGSSAERVWAWV